MTSANPEYIDNLQYFLQHSDEDHVDSQYFVRRFPELYLGDNEHLAWLDVGAGPGTKPIQILKGGLTEQFASIELDTIEPASAWRSIFSANLEEANLGNVLRETHETCWEDFESEQKYDLITFFHSTYGIHTEALKRIPDYLQNNGLACIVVESPNSSLHLIKKSIASYLKHEELMSSSETITAFLSEEGIDHVVDEEDSEQRFYVDEILDANDLDGYLSFILQTKPEDHNMETPSQLQRKIFNELRKHVKKDDVGSYINVPDRFIWIRKNG